MKSSIFLLAGLVCGALAPAGAQSTASNPAASTEVSLGPLLQLQPRQNERLRRLYDDSLSRRASSKAKSANWAAVHAQALQMLPPVQRSQVASLAGDTRFRLRHDFLFELLVTPLDGARQAGDAGARQNWLDARRLTGENIGKSVRGVGNYGVYGGYGYGGPQVSVYGGYQQGAVGVHAGVGRGGPSIGISLGRVFGIGR